MRKKHLLLVHGLFLAIFLFPSSVHSQICNPTETWISLDFPGWYSSAMTEMNGNLYAVSIEAHWPGSDSFFLQKFDGHNWTRMSYIPLSNLPNISFIYKMITYKGQIYIGGRFPNRANKDGIMRWDSLNNQWLDVGGGTNDQIYDMEVYQGELYIGGIFGLVGNNVIAPYIAKWNGSNWSSVGNPQLPWVSPMVRSLTTWNGNLVIGGRFKGPNVQYLNQWDGSNWLGFPSYPHQEVAKLGTYKGDLIIQGYSIDSIGNQAIHKMGRWDGTQWHAMGMAALDSYSLQDMLEYNNEFYILGGGTLQNFFFNGRKPFDGIAKWDGFNWHAVTGFTSYGHDLAIFQDRLYMAGDLFLSCNVPKGALARLCDTSQCILLSGQAFQDDNSNCIRDLGEFPLDQVVLEIQPRSQLVYTDSKGRFSKLIDDTTSSINISVLSSPYTSSCPQNGYTNLTVNGTNNLQFGLTPIPNVRDLQIIATTFRFRPGRTTRIYVHAKNKGSVPQVGYIELILDSLLTVSNLSAPLSIQKGDTLQWTFPVLMPTQQTSFWVDVSLPPSAINFSGMLLPLVAHIFPKNSDLNPKDNAYFLYPRITNSFDPNDKQVTPKGIGTIGEIPLETEKFTYTIRFQNTGTDTAFNIYIQDSISSYLKLTSLQTLASSHPYQVQMEEGNLIKWTFDNILLPDSNTNESASHGFVKYKINLKPNLPLGTRIENQAAIYFDFNSPIITNRTVNTLVEPILSITSSKNPFPIKIYPQPADESVHIELKQSLKNGSIQIFDLQGRQLLSLDELSGRQFSIPVNSLQQGLYLMSILDNDEMVVLKKLLIK